MEVMTCRGLADFCVYFLESILVQITFMGGLLELASLRKRVEGAFGLDLLHLGKKGEDLMKIVRVLVDEGEIDRTRVQTVIGKGATVSAGIIKLGLSERLFSSPSPKGVLRVEFSETLREHLFPRLYLDLPVLTTDVE